MVALVGCTVKVPRDMRVVQNFDVSRYLGEWYEIARLDHSFERGLTKTTANYSLNADGSVKVVNKGFNPAKNKWKQSEGKASFVGQPNVASLKVTFFWPFYGGYNVIALDDNYQYALVAGPDRDYLWILSRTPTIPETVKAQYLAIAEQYGFETEKLIWVQH